MNAVKKIRILLDRQEKKRFLLLFAMMIFAAVLETFGIGLIGPFVSVVTNPELIQQNAILLKVYNLLHFHSVNSFLIAMTVALLMAFVVKNLYLLFFYFFQFRIIYNAQVRMSRRLLSAYLAKPYVFHLSRNSADLVRNTNTEIQKMFDRVIVPSFVFATELLVVISLFSLLIVTSPIATILSAILLGGSVTLFMKIFRKRMSEAGVKQQQAQGGMIKWVNQSLGAAKEVKVSGREEFFVNSYNRESTAYADTAKFYTMMQQSPRLFIETITVGTILAIVLVIMMQSNDLTQLLSTVAMFGMAAFRLMPSINRMVSALTQIRTNLPALDVIYEDLKDEPDTAILLEEIKSNSMAEPVDQAKVFVDAIHVDHVSFRYPSVQTDALSDINITIPIGSSAAFIGESGSGKTTLADIILGILDPYRGSVKVDGVKTSEIKELWQQKIGYIPQSIYLSDDTIRRNVAFGLEDNEIDDERVWRALEQAQMMKYVDRLPGKLDAFVGENGVRMSGGQRQRIGIARALYNKPEILFLDEATSALDNETEKDIMSAIYNLQGEKTLIIIAHRLSTIENCNLVFKLSQGKVESVTQKQIA